MRPVLMVCFLPASVPFTFLPVLAAREWMTPSRCHAARPGHSDRGKAKASSPETNFFGEQHIQSPQKPAVSLERTSRSLGFGHLFPCPSPDVLVQ